MANAVARDVLDKYLRDVEFKKSFDRLEKADKAVLSPALTNFSRTGQGLFIGNSQKTKSASERNFLIFLPVVSEREQAKPPLQLTIPLL
jgi:hypothetical protein